MFTQRTVNEFTYFSPQTILLMKKRCSLLVTRGLVSIRLSSYHFLRQSLVADPPDVAFLKRQCLSLLLGTYSNHRSQKDMSHFPETLLLFLFLCGGITVKQKMGWGGSLVGNNIILGVPDHRSLV